MRTELTDMEKARKLAKFAGIAMMPSGAIYCHPDDLEQAKKLAPPGAEGKVKPHPFVERGQAYAVDEDALTKDAEEAIRDYDGR
jgi:hypothetical protein